MKKSRVDDQNLIEIYENVLNEEMISGGGGVFGNFPSHGGDIENSDWYAPGDTRIPKSSGVLTRQGKLKKKKKIAKKRRK